MRLRFFYNRKITDDFRIYMSENLEKMGSVIGYSFDDNYLDVTFRTGEDDYDSIFELSEARGFYLAENGPERPVIGRINIVSALFLFVISVILADNLIQTFCSLLVFLLCGNRIVIYAGECISRFRLSVAFFSSLVTFMCIFYGVFSFIFPRYDFLISVFGSLIMNLTMIYYYLFDVKR